MSAPREARGKDWRGDEREELVVVNVGHVRLSGDVNERGGGGGIQVEASGGRVGGHGWF